MPRSDRNNSSRAGHARMAAIDRAAADWVARSGRGLTSAEQKEFSHWCASDPAHAAAFTEFERTWRALDDLKNVPMAGGRRLDDDLPPVGGYRRRRRVFFHFVLAAAAGIAMTLFVRSPSASPGVIAQSATTEVGGFKIMSLPDGSIVQLNTDSAVEIRYTGAERRAYLLKGEASFDVAKDSMRPFIVRARSVAVRAVGTAFNVRLRAEACEVLVTAGKVCVDSSASRDSLVPVMASRAEPAVLVAGERIVVDLAALTAVSPGTMPAVAASHVAVVSTEDIRRELAWQDRRLEFESTPFTEVVAEFNRHNHHKLVIADPRLAERRFGGSFSAGNAEAFVRLLEDRFGVKAERRENETRLRLDQ